MKTVRINKFGQSNHFNCLSLSLVMVISSNACKFIYLLSMFFGQKLWVDIFMFHRQWELVCCFLLTIFALCDKVCQWLSASWWFSPGTLAASTNKTDFHNITEILLKVPLNTMTISITPIFIMCKENNNICTI